MIFFSIRHTEIYEFFAGLHPPLGHNFPKIKKATYSSNKKHGKKAVDVLMMDCIDVSPTEPGYMSCEIRRELAEQSERLMRKLLSVTYIFIHHNGSTQKIQTYKQKAE